MEDAVAAILIAISSGIVTGLVSWGALRNEMKWIRAAVMAAHDRLDALGAPGGPYSRPAKRRHNEE